jgi:hypothetical protein
VLVCIVILICPIKDVHIVERLRTESFLIARRSSSDVSGSSCFSRAMSCDVPAVQICTNTAVTDDQLISKINAAAEFAHMPRGDV